ncbi:MAG TPA: hypothetical protein VFG68_13160 [Fimbriiglobus sp.]|nr:hypothetical protein [Fimbriiglobus sp.]
MPSTLPAWVCGAPESARGVVDDCVVDRHRRLPHLGLGRVEQNLGESPVHDLDFAEGPDHYVGRFQVAVDDPAVVSIGDREADLLERRYEVVCGSVGQQFGEGLPFDELHREERAAIVGLSDLEDRGDAGVLEPAGDAGLLDEPPHGCRLFSVADLK